MGNLMEIGSIYEMAPGSCMRQPEEADSQWRSEAACSGQGICTGSSRHGDGTRQPEAVQKRSAGAACSGQQDSTGDCRQVLHLKEVHKYGRGNISYTASGREAIALALKSMEKNHPKLVKRCLMPAYMCDSVFFPFERAGWELVFYPVGEDLRADREVLSALIRESRPGLLFVHSYYGVDTWQHLRAHFGDWKKQGVRILEDVTQSYYLETGGQGADDIVGSLRKWYPIPDGGFVASQDPLEEPEGTGQEEAASARAEILTQKWRYLYDSRSWKKEEREACKQHFLDANRQMEEVLDHQLGARPMSSLSREILSQIDEEVCKKRRQENYRHLCHFFRLQEERLWQDADQEETERRNGGAQRSEVQPVKEEETEEQQSEVQSFGTQQQKAQDTEGLRGCRMLLDEMERAAPLYLPVMAGDRDGLQRYLRERQIFAPVLWPVGRENEDFLTDTEHKIYGHMLALPLDQRYGQQEMEYLCRTLAGAMWNRG